MTITCPHCGFSKDIDARRIPARVSRVTCPRCKQGFPLEAAAAQGPRDEAEPAVAAEETLQAPPASPRDPGAALGRGPAQSRFLDQVCRRGGRFGARPGGPAGPRVCPGSGHDHDHRWSEPAGRIHVRSGHLVSRDAPVDGLLRLFHRLLRADPRAKWPFGSR